MSQSRRFMDVEVAHVSKNGGPKIFISYQPKLNSSYPIYFAAISEWAREVEDDREQDRVRESNQA